MASGGRSTHGTVMPFAQFNAEEDCKALYKAMKGLGTDEATIIRILTGRSNAQRQALKAPYKTVFGKVSPVFAHFPLTKVIKFLLFPLFLFPPFCPGSGGASEERDLW